MKIQILNKRRKNQERSGEIKIKEIIHEIRLETSKGSVAFSTLRTYENL